MVEPQNIKLTPSRYVGKPCRNCGGTVRKKSNGGCVPCAQLKYKEHRKIRYVEDDVYRSKALSYRKRSNRKRCAEDTKDYRLKKRLSTYRSRHLKKDPTRFDLDLEWLRNKYEAGCELTGLSFSPLSSDVKEACHSPSREGPLTFSVDRIDSNLGYTKDNCRAILWCLNSFISNFGLDAVLPVAQALVAKHQAALTTPPTSSSLPSV
jgi:hypothetical protein